MDMSMDLLSSSRHLHLILAKQDFLREGRLKSPLRGAKESRKPGVPATHSQDSTPACWEQPDRLAGPVQVPSICPGLTRAWRQSPDGERRTQPLAAEPHRVDSLLRKLGGTQLTGTTEQPLEVGHQGQLPGPVAL